MRTIVVLVALAAMAGRALAQSCCGDVDGDAVVAVHEIMAAIAAALIGCPTDAPCAGDCDSSGTVVITELIVAVNNAMQGCPITPTATPTPTPTTIPVPASTCPINFDTAPAMSDLRCVYTGDAFTSCSGNTQATAWWTSDGTNVTVTVVTDEEPLAVMTGLREDLIAPSIHGLTATIGAISLGDGDPMNATGAVLLAPDSLQFTARFGGDCQDFSFAGFVSGITHSPPP